MGTKAKDALKSTANAVYDKSAELYHGKDIDVLNAEYDNLNNKHDANNRRLSELEDQKNAPNMTQKRAKEIANEINKLNNENASIKSKLSNNRLKYDKKQSDIKKLVGVGDNSEPIIERKIGDINKDNEALNSESVRIAEEREKAKAELNELVKNQSEGNPVDPEKIKQATEDLRTIQHKETEIQNKLYKNQSESQAIIKKGNELISANKLSPLFNEEYNNNVNEQYKKANNNGNKEEMEKLLTEHSNIKEQHPDTLKKFDTLSSTFKDENIINKIRHDKPLSHEDENKITSHIHTQHPNIEAKHKKIIHDQFKQHIKERKTRFGKLMGHGGSKQKYTKSKKLKSKKSTKKLQKR
jgi:hypothetical protein